MAKGNKTGGRDFKHGQINNPAGRPPTPEYLKTARKLTKVRFEGILHKYLDHNKDELAKVLKDPETKAIDLCVIKILHEAIIRGDQRRLEFILDRLLGKVVEPINVSGGVYSELMDMIQKRKEKNGE